MRKVGELVAEIHATSAKGIEQLNRAVMQMDHSIQRSTSSAEDSAAASEPMNAQAEHMMRFVSDLVTPAGSRSANSRDDVETENPMEEAVREFEPAMQKVSAETRQEFSE